MDWDGGRLSLRELSGTVMGEIYIPPVSMDYCSQEYGMTCIRCSLSLPFVHLSNEGGEGREVESTMEGVEWNSLVSSLDGRKGRRKGDYQLLSPFHPFISLDELETSPSLPFSREWNPLFMDREKREYPVEERQLVAPDEISPFHLPFVQSAHGMGRRSEEEEEDDSTFFRD